MSVPWPEGSPQKPPTAQQSLAYLDALGQWIDDCKADIDRLDERVRDKGPFEGIQDIAMTLTVWQAIQHRYSDLLKVWDNGRADEVVLAKLSALTWANLNDMLTPGASIATGGGLALSLPEACRMLEALIAQMSSHYQLVQLPDQTSSRVAALLAQVERIRDQAKLDAPDVRERTTPLVDNLAADTQLLVEKAGRGGDVGGLIGPLEVRASELERDLIVGHAQRSNLGKRVDEVRQVRAQLIAREESVGRLAEATRHAMTPAPKYAVPHVESLGPVPSNQSDLDAYLARLTQVRSALDVVEKANKDALGRVASLVTRLKVASTRLEPSDNVATALANQARTLLDRNPAPVDVIEPLLTALEATGRPK